MNYYTYFLPDCNHTYELLQAHTNFNVFDESLKKTTEFVKNQDKQKLLNTPFHVLQKEAHELLKYYETNPEVLAIVNFDTDIAPFTSDVTKWFLACQAKGTNSQVAEKMCSVFTHYILNGGNIEIIRRYLAEQEAKIKAGNLSIKKRVLKDISYFEGLLEIDTTYDKLFKKAFKLIKENKNGITELANASVEFDPYYLDEVVCDKIATLVTLDPGEHNKNPFYRGLINLSSAARLMQQEAESE